jgi:hypothetical protein
MADITVSNASSVSILNCFAQLTISRRLPQSNHITTE